MFKFNKSILYVYLYVFNKYNFCKQIVVIPILHTFQIRINCGSRKISNPEK